MTLTTGVVLGMFASGRAHITYALRTESKQSEIIPAVFRLHGNNLIFFNGSLHEDDSITLASPCLARQPPYSITVEGRRGVDITRVIDTLSKSDLTEFYLTATAADAPQSTVCAKAVHLFARDRTAFPLGATITAELIGGTQVVLRSSGLPFSQVSELHIRNMGERAMRICDIPAREDGTVTVPLPVKIPDGDCLDLWLTGSLLKNK